LGTGFRGGSNLPRDNPSSTLSHGTFWEEQSEGRGRIKKIERKNKKRVAICLSSRTKSLRICLSPSRSPFDKLRANGKTIEL
jgi:hypothetical protein